MSSNGDSLEKDDIHWDKTSIKVNKDSETSSNAANFKGEFSCQKCGGQFPDLSELETHLVTCNMLPYTCRACNKSFDDLKLIVKHVNSHSKPYVCMVCGAGFHFGEDCQRHLAVHNGSGLSLNDLTSPKVFMLQNTGTIGENSKWACKICSLAFKQELDYKIHTMVHEGSHFFQCTICEKDFKVADCLESHVRRHIQGENFCEICQKNYNSDNFNMKFHRKRVHGTKGTASCPQCGLCFGRIRELKVHLEKCKICIECGKYHLKMRIFRHTCDICSWKFINRLQYDKHMRQRHPDLKIEKYEYKPQNNKHIQPRHSNLKVEKNEVMSQHSKHVRPRHPDLKIEKSADTSQYNKQTQLQQVDLELENDEEPLNQSPPPCTVCGKIFDFIEDLCIHLERDHIMPALTGALKEDESVTVA